VKSVANDLIISVMLYTSASWRFVMSWIDSSDNLKICDLGLATLCGTEQQHATMTTGIGTPAYM
jgi:hypothetical protein